MTEVVAQIEELRIVPVVAIEDVDDADRLADALIEGGLPCAEITLRTDAGLAVIETLSKRSDFLVGAGTVHNARQAQQVIDAGARFVVAPGFNPKTVEWCLQNDAPIFPGASSPTDLEMALEFDLETVKFFPAESLGGVSMLKALSGPYGGIRFMPTGGIDQNNMMNYLDLPQVVACGGSWMVKSSWIQNGRFEEVAVTTAEAMLLAQGGKAITEQ